MYCDRIMLGGQPNHGRQLCLPRLIARRWVDPRLYDGSDL